MQQLEMRAEYGSARAYYQQALAASGEHQPSCCNDAHVLSESYESPDLCCKTPSIDVTHAHLHGCFQTVVTTVLTHAECVASMIVLLKAALMKRRPRHTMAYTKEMSVYVCV